MSIQTFQSQTIWLQYLKVPKHRQEKSQLMENLCFVNRDSNLNSVFPINVFDSV